jgi:hypothetical protein
MSAVGSRTLTPNKKAAYTFFGMQKRVKVSSVYCYRGRNFDPSLHAHQQALVHRLENQIIVRKYEI